MREKDGWMDAYMHGWRRENMDCSVYKLLQNSWMQSPHTCTCFSSDIMCSELGRLAHGSQPCPTNLMAQSCLLKSSVTAYTMAFSWQASFPKCDGQPCLMSKSQDIDTQSYCSKDPAKVLVKHECEKKQKYLSQCLAQCKEITLLVFSACIGQKLVQQVCT